MRRSVFLLFLILAAPALADWSVEPGSSVGFVSIKNNAIGENNAFTRVAGGIDAKGNISVKVDLSSVDTGVGIRNERLQTMLFEVGMYPAATVTGKLSEDQLAKLSSGGQSTAMLEVTVDLHGQQAKKMAALSVAASNGQAQVVSAQPIMLSAAEFGLESGVAALQQIAGLNAISRSIPVTVDLTLSSD
jgi:polyisoprenoid-binding protein YceI